MKLPSMRETILPLVDRMVIAAEARGYWVGLVEGLGRYHYVELDFDIEYLEV